MKHRDDSTSTNQASTKDSKSDFEYKAVSDVSPLDLVDEVLLSGQVSSASAPARPVTPTGNPDGDD